MIKLYLTNPLLEIISAWQSLTVSPLRLSSSPLTQRFPENKREEKYIQCQHTQQSNAPRFYSDLIPIQTLTFENTLLWTLKFHWQHLFRCRELDCTSSQANNGPQAVPFPHDDGGQDLASQEAVLDACRQRVETLVTQHGDLVMQSAASNRKLKRNKKSTFAEGWPHNCACKKEWT